jgi:hypothetical protein
MSRHHQDPFPVQGRYLGVDPIDHDPLEIAIAQREAREASIRQAIANGTYDIRQPLNPRGWPIQTKGVSSTSPGTDPAREAERRDHRLRRTA